MNQGAIVLVKTVFGSSILYRVDVIDSYGDALTRVPQSVLLRV